MEGYYTLSINCVGGVISPNYLHKILRLASEYHLPKVRFGLRQQLFLYVPENLMATFGEALSRAEIIFQTETSTRPNIVSSYVGEEVFQSGNWLSEGVYQDIFDGFRHLPRLKINLSDNQQSFTPFFSGHLNFIASEKPNYWFLYLRLPKTNTIVGYEKLIYFAEIPGICLHLESLILDEAIHTAPELFSRIALGLSVPIEKPLTTPKFNLPYYEGFNRYGSKTWLGIYRRDEFFDTDFLLAMCELCLLTKIGEVCVTPWKSLIIKGINPKDRPLWSELLSKYHLNIRHAASELNWQIEDHSPKALALKHQLVRAFDRDDLRTFGLCFGIKTIPKTEVFASVMVRERPWIFPFLKVYDISYTPDFDPNGREKVYFSRGIFRYQLSEQVRRIVMLFNHREIPVQAQEIPVGEITRVIQKKSVAECSVCYTVYDENFGDSLNTIPPGIPFSDLPISYCCSICEAPKTAFRGKQVVQEFQE